VLAKALQRIYPTHSWDLLRFQHTRRFWTNFIEKNDNNTSNPGNVIVASLLSEISKKFGLPFSPSPEGRKSMNYSEGQLNEWYRVHLSELSSKQRALLQKYGGIAGALRWAFPNHDWDPSLFGRLHSKASQQSLLKYTHNIFPGEGAVANFRLIHLLTWC